MVFQDLEAAEGTVQAALDRGDSTYAFWLTLLFAAEGRETEVSAFMKRDLAEGYEWQPEFERGVVELYTGDDPAAARDLRAAYDTRPFSRGYPGRFPSRFLNDRDTLLGLALLGAGEKEPGLRLLNEAETAYTDRIANGDTSFQARIQMAAIHALRGDKEAAYDWLERAIDAGFFAYREAERHPFFESLRGEERFQQMMAGVEERVEEMRRQWEADKAKR